MRVRGHGVKPTFKGSDNVLTTSCRAQPLFARLSRPQHGRNIYIRPARARTHDHVNMALQNH